MDRLNRMARLSARERQQIIDEFAAGAGEGLDAGPRLLDRLRGGGHRLPDAPTQEQLDAWLELSELVSDPRFRRLARTALERSAGDHGEGGGPVDWGSDVAGNRHAEGAFGQEAILACKSDNEFSIVSPRTSNNIANHQGMFVVVVFSEFDDLIL